MNSGKKKMKQATIESLKGVVVINEFQKISASLKNYEQLEAENILKLLNKVGKKYPTPEVIKSTAIGKRLTTLCKHDNKEVSCLAKSIKSAWVNRIVYLKTRKEVDVLCAPEIERKRQKYRNILTDALNKKDVENSVELSKQAEWKIFRLICKDASNPRYSRLMRLLVQKVQYRDEFVPTFVNSVDKCIDKLDKETK